MGSGRGIGESGSGSGPQGNAEGRLIEVPNVLSGNGFEWLRFAVDPTGRRLAFSPGARGHAEELAEGDVGLARIIQREGLW